MNWIETLTISMHNIERNLKLRNTMHKFNGNLFKLTSYTPLNNGTNPKTLIKQVPILTVLFTFLVHF